VRKRFFLLLAGGLTAAVAGTLALVPAPLLAQPDPGPTVTRLLTLPAAEGLDVELFADVTVAEGSPQRITVTGPAALLDQLRAENDNGVLRFRLPNTAGGWLRKVRPAERLQLSVVVPVLRLVKFGGAGTLTGLTPLAAPVLKVELAGAGHAILQVANTSTCLRLSGAGDITLRGTTTRQDVRLSGAGSYHGFELQSAEAVLDIAGVGTAELTATRSLTTNLSGMARVRYRGRPAVLTSHVSGLSSVTDSE